MELLLHICAFIIELYCVCLWNNVSCEHGRYKRCLLANNERRFGDHIVWKEACRSRRKARPPSDTMWKLPHMGPKLSPEYDPTIGYEPYWEDGDWVFEKQLNVSGDACGQECSPFYKYYGKICGIKRHRNYQVQHKTFENYCEMLNVHCEVNNNMYNPKMWLIAYRGECLPEIKTFPTRPSLIRGRAVYYLTALEERLPVTDYKFPGPKHMTTTKKKS